MRNIGTKGPRETLQEEPLFANLTPYRILEESASHHLDMIWGVSGQVTTGAPEGPYRRRRVLRTMCGQSTMCVSTAILIKKRHFLLRKSNLNCKYCHIDISKNRYFSVNINIDKDHLGSLRDTPECLW